MRTGGCGPRRTVWRGKEHVWRSRGTQGRGLGSCVYAQLEEDLKECQVDVREAVADEPAARAVCEALFEDAQRREALHRARQALSLATKDLLVARCRRERRRGVAVSQGDH